MITPTLDDFRTLDAPTIAAIHRLWLDRGLPASTWPAFLARHQQLRHVHDLIESATTDECAFCCKVFRCSCGETEVRHMASYGCPIGRSVGAA